MNSPITRGSKSTSHRSIDGIYDRDLITPKRFARPSIRQDQTNFQQTVQPLSQFIHRPAKRLQLAAVFLLATLVVGSLLASFPFPAARASGTYLASDVLGQSDGNGITFAKNFPNKASGLDGFINPKGMAFDAMHHRLFISDQNRVLVFNLDNSNNLIDRTADYVLGQADFGSGSATTTQSGMSFPSGLAYDAANDRLFEADAGNNRILVFDTTTITNGMNAVNVLGQVNFTSSGSAVTQSGMSFPSGLAYDVTNNRLFVDDFNNSRVLVFDTTTITNGENAVNVLVK